MLQSVVGQSDPVGVKGVRFDDVRTRGQIRVVDRFDRPGSGEVEQVVVPTEVPWPVLESFAAERCLVETQLLDLRPHRTVEDENAALELRPESSESGGAGGPGARARYSCQHITRAALRSFPRSAAEVAAVAGFLRTKASRPVTRDRLETACSAPLRPAPRRAGAVR